MTEKNDWFDVYAVVHFGDEFKISLIRLSKNLLNGIREYILPDKRIAILPEDWFVKYIDLLSFAEKSKGGMRIRKMHSLMLEDAMSDSREITQKVIRSLTNGWFKNKVDVPSEINATLRSYQIEGFWWLNFLRSSKLGACLADDMGLGKTLQTLCLLSYHAKQQENKLKKKTNPLHPN